MAHPLREVGEVLCSEQVWMAAAGKGRGAASSTDSVCHPTPPVSHSPDQGKGEEDGHALCLSDVLSTELDISFHSHKREAGDNIPILRMGKSAQ